ncbi:MAG: Fur family transcriptional regulator [Anaeroplasma sp.]
MIRRCTSQENIVYNSLANLGHATTDNLIIYIMKNYSNISLATIYRNINKLIDEEKIKKLKIGEVDVLETVKEKHYHFYCKKCKNIIDVNPNQINTYIDCEDNSFTVEDYDVALYGICKACKKNLYEG